MSKLKNFTGHVFGRLTVIEIIKGSPVKWRCQCVCGNIVTPHASNIVRGMTKSCGCFKKEWAGKNKITHGHSTGGKVSATYRSWAHAISRCTNPNVPEYAYYGARGISVCERWLSFENFVADMGEKPEGLTIERINNNGNYEPQNCKWADMKEQGKNKRNNKLLSWNGETHHLSEWARKLNIPMKRLSERLINGWSIEKSFTQPKRENQNGNQTTC